MTSFIDNCNKVDRTLCQAGAILTALQANDHFKDISADIVAGALWAVQDAIKAAEDGAKAMHLAWQSDCFDKRSQGDTPDDDAGNLKLKTTLLELREIKENAEAIVFSCEALSEFNNHDHEPA